MSIKAPFYREYADSLGEVISTCTDFAFVSTLERKIAANNPEALETFACAYKSNQARLKSDCRGFHHDAKKALAKFKTICQKYDIASISDDEAFLSSVAVAKDFEDKITFLSKVKNTCINEQRIIPPTEFEYLFKVEQGTA